METVTRVCLLTGASGPLGQAFLAAHGAAYCTIAVSHRHPVPGAEDFARCPLTPMPGMWSVPANLARPDTPETLVRTVLERLGRIDCVIHSAAVRRFASLADLMTLDWAGSMVQVNVMAALRLSLALLASGWQNAEDNRRHNRHLLLISSTAALRIYTGSGQGLYATTKVALNHLALHMANEYGPQGIRVNAVCPDSFPTRVPLGAVVARMRELDVGMMTGQVVPVLGPRGFDP